MGAVPDVAQTTPHEPASAAQLEHFKLPDGFAIEPAAVPPLVEHPMMGCLDETGRLFIAESAGVNRTAPELNKTRPHKILMLEDTDRDGRYDRRTVFAEGLVEPNGAAWYQGALYVCSAPYVWRFEDTDDDGRADTQQRIVGKFNFIGMSDALHGPTLGPDGRLYFCGGQHGWRLEQVTADRGRNAPDPSSLQENFHNETIVDKWVSMAPGLFACWPDGSQPEAIGAAGICNPVEVTFTEAGEPLGTVAVYDMVDGRHDALLDWIEGSVYNLKETSYANVKLTGEPLAPFSRRGHVAPAGLVRYRGDAFGTAYRDNVFLCEFNTHKVHSVALAREGATFRHEEKVFLSSDLTDTHFTDLIEDADGSLLVIDTGGWFLRGCPTSQIAKPQILGGIYRIRRQDVAKVDDPRGLSIAWQTLDNVKLAELLDDPRRAVRDRAIAQLAARGPAALESLEATLLHARSSRATINALWAICRIGGADALRINRRALDAGDLNVRLVAMHVAGLHRDKAAAAQFINALHDGDAHVRRAASTALGRIGDPAAVKPLLAALGTTSDRFLEHSLIYAIIRIDDRDTTLPGLSEKLTTVRRAALIALDRMEHGGLTRDLVAPHLDSADESLQRVALEVVAHRRWASEITDLLASWLEDDLTDTRRAALSAALIALGSTPKIQDLIGHSLVKQQVPASTKELLLEAMAQIAPKTLPDSWTSALPTLLRSSDPRLVQAAVATIASSGQRLFTGELVDTARRAELSPAVRVSAAAAAAQQDSELPDEVVELLVRQCAPDVDAVERMTAARGLGAARLSSMQLGQVIPLVRTAGPLELSSLMSALEQPTARGHAAQIIDALKHSPALTSVSAARVEKLLGASAADEPTTRALLGRLKTAGLVESARLKELAPALAGGDPARGRNVFFGNQASCSACHRVGDRGEMIGPNLSRIGEIRTRRDLLEAVVFPSASFARGFEPFNVATSSGKIYAGLVSRETADALYLRTSDRAEVRIAREDIEDLGPSTQSIMPQGLDKALNLEQLQDLLAYLASLREQTAAAH